MPVKPGIYSMEEARRLGLIEDLPAASSGTTPTYSTQPDQTAGDDAIPDSKSTAAARRPRRTNPGTYKELRSWAEGFNDAQAVRVAFENKERSATVSTEAFAATVSLYKQAEEIQRREMTECYRCTVPESIRKWQEATAGVGESTLARLLGTVGDPRMAYPMHWEGSGNGDRHLVEDPAHPRTVGQLWQYCGHGAPKRRDVKGDAAALMANGKPSAKMLVHLLAEAQVKTNAKGGGAYRWLYDATKVKYQERTHSGPCPGGFFSNLYVKCKTGPGKAYAEAGDPFQKSHVHAIALRIVGKALLRDLWLAAGD